VSTQSRNSNSLTSVRTTRHTHGQYLIADPDIRAAAVVLVRELPCRVLPLLFQVFGDFVPARVLGYFLGGASFLLSIVHRAVR
jgi:hypothetical protein